MMRGCVRWYPFVAHCHWPAAMCRVGGTRAVGMSWSSSNSNQYCCDRTISQPARPWSPSSSSYGGGWNVRNSAGWWHFASRTLTDRQRGRSYRTTPSLDRRHGNGRRAAALTSPRPTSLMYMHVDGAAIDRGWLCPLSFRTYVCIYRWSGWRERERESAVAADALHSDASALLSNIFVPSDLFFRRRGSSDKWTSL